MTSVGLHYASTPSLDQAHPLRTKEPVFSDESSFERMIAIERKRAERSKQPFLLMLIEVAPRQAAKLTAILFRVASLLRVSIRESDVIGWYKDRTVLGIIFTGLNREQETILRAIAPRVKATLRAKLTADQLDDLSLSYHFYPDEWHNTSANSPTDSTLYPDLAKASRRRLADRVVKRAMDLILSLIVLIVLAPLLLTIALAVRASSRGPILFRQKRVGEQGKVFTFLKFRSMYLGNDPAIHKSYVEQLIAGEAACQLSQVGGEQIYKITNDARITPLGKFLRRSSIDELPQLINVLRGDMSLVGPRPPIPYEVSAYQSWHRQRVLRCKPGITGLWQVVGRSRVSFDQMVRLDLQYARSSSPWLDFRILMLTPSAVLKGAGAF